MIRSIIIIILLVIILSLLGVDFSGVLENPTIKSNFLTLWHWISYVFITYLKEPLTGLSQKLMDWLTSGSDSALINKLYS